MDCRRLISAIITVNAMSVVAAHHGRHIHDLGACPQAGAARLARLLVLFTPRSHDAIRREFNFVTAISIILFSR